MLKETTRLLSGLLLLAMLALPTLSPAQVTEDKAPDSAHMEINGRLVPPVVATVNGEEIPGPMLVNQVQMYKMVTQQQGGQISPEQEAAYAKESLDNLIGQELLYQKAKEWGISVDAKTVRAEVQKIRDQFPNEKMYRHALRLQGLSDDLLRVSIEKQLVEQEVVQTRLAPKVDVSDEAVREFYEQNRQGFLKPPRWEISHIFVAAVEQEPPEDPAQRKRFERLQERVIADAREKIETVRSKLKSGKKFEDLAREFSEHEETAQNGGKWGTMSRKEMPPLIFETVSKLEPGQTSDIVRSEFGFHILRLDAKHPEEAIPLEQVKSELLNHLLREEVVKEKEKLVTELRDQADVEVFF